MPGDFRVSPSTGRYEVPHYSIKLCTYDPAIIAAFARLRKNRKQAAFTHEALKNFLTTEKGGQMLLLMEGERSEVKRTAPQLSAEVMSEGITTEKQDRTDLHPACSEDIDSRIVLDRILN